MNWATATRLLEINRRFYLEHARDFSATRQRAQPGVWRVIAELQNDETVLDLGCGNGAFARALSQHGHQGAYLGLDFSPTLLETASLARYNFPVTFRQVDLTVLRRVPADASANPPELTEDTTRKWTVITAFSLLHHIPGQGLQLQLLMQARDWLLPGGRLILSVWQFSTSGRMRSRTVPWADVGISADDIDEGDYLVDWRQGERGLRYVHEFRESELRALAAESGFRVQESYLSDGVDHRSGLYQMWRPA